MMKRLLSLVCVLIVAMLSFQPAVSQDTGSRAGDGYVTGTVMFGLLNYIEDATVKVEGTSIECKTDQDGKFNMSVPAGIYNMTFSADGFYDAAKKDVNITAGNTTNLIWITLDPITGDIEGKVTDDISGNALAWAFVTIQGLGWTTWTENDGTYSIDDVPVGTYKVNCTKGMYYNEMTLDVTVKENETSTLDFAIHSWAKDGGIVEITVKDPITEETIPDVKIYFDGDLKGTTDDNGHVQITALETGNYLVTAQKDGYAYYETDGDLQDDKMYEWTLFIQPGYNVTFTVTDGDGNPVAGANVRMGEVKGQTDASGKVTLLISKYSEELRVNGTGYRPVAETVPITTEGQQVPVTMVKESSGGSGGSSSDGLPMAAVIGIVVVIVVVVVVAVALMMRRKKGPAVQQTPPQYQQQQQFQQPPPQQGPPVG